MVAPSWPLSETYSCPEFAGADPGLQSEAEAWAGELLWRLSGRRYGTREVTVRPYVPSEIQSYETFGVWLDSGYEGGPVWVPYVWDGTPLYGHPHWLSLCSGRQVWLPGPVYAVTEVRVRGEVLPASAYRVDNRQYLVRQDGEPWPRNADPSQPPDEADLLVTYVQGTPVPQGGRIAAAALACEYVKFRLGLDHRLTPGTVSSITRQGIQMEVIPLDESDGLTGVHEADQWLRAVNPQRLTRRPAVSSPDVPIPREQTWPSP